MTGAGVGVIPIEPHSETDNLYVIQSGLVFCKAKVYSAGKCLGEDSIGAYRCVSTTVRLYSLVLSLLYICLTCLF